MLPVNGPLSGQIIGTLNQMLLKTHCLIHLEVSHCGIQEEEVLLIAQTMKKSKTLNSNHP